MIVSSEESNYGKKGASCMGFCVAVFMVILLPSSVFMADEEVQYVYGYCYGKAVRGAGVY